MIMEVPPFHWPKPAFKAFFLFLGARLKNECRGNSKCRQGALVKRAEIKSGALCVKNTASPGFSVMLNVGKPKWGAFTRLETRTKESNRRAREKRTLKKPSLVLKGFLFGVHTTRMPNTDRPPVG